MSEEKQKQTWLEWYSKNKRKVIKRSIIWNKELKKTNPDRWKEMRKRIDKKYSQSPRGIYKAITQNCLRKKRKVEIDIDSFTKWYNEEKKECFYCKKPQGIKRMSIDRKDNNITYRLDNIALACDDCNSVKGNILTEQEMLLVGRLIMKKRWLK